MFTLAPCWISLLYNHHIPLSTRVVSWSCTGFNNKDNAFLRSHSHQAHHNACRQLPQLAVHQTYIYVHLIIENGYWLTCRKVTSWYVGLHTNPPSPARHAILQTIATDIGTRCMCTMRTPAYSMPSTLNLAYSCCCIVNVHLTFCYHGDSANYHVGIS